MAKEFVVMQKDGERIKVSPLVVAEHERLGWKVAGGKPAASAQTAAAPQGPSLKERRKAYIDELKAKSDEDVAALAKEQGVEDADSLSRKKLDNRLIELWNEENQE